MKKLTAILLLLCMLFCLCSCDALDQMKMRHGIINDDGTILLNGNTYIPATELDVEDITDYLPKGNTYSCYITVTQKDVPTLLSPFFGYMYDAHIGLEYIHYHYFHDYKESTYFRKDVFENIKARIKQRRLL